MTGGLCWISFESMIRTGTGRGSSQSSKRRRRRRVTLSGIETLCGWAGMQRLSRRDCSRWSERWRPEPTLSSRLTGQNCLLLQQHPQQHQHQARGLMLTCRSLMEAVTITQVTVTRMRKRRMRTTRRRKRRGMGGEGGDVEEYGWMSPGGRQRLADMAERYGIEEYGRHMDLAVSALEKEKRLRQMAGNDSRPSRKERKKLARQGKEGGGQGKKQQGKGEAWKQQGLVGVGGNTEGQRGHDGRGRDRERERGWDRDSDRRREGDRWDRDLDRGKDRDRGRDRDRDREREQERGRERDRDRGEDAGGRGSRGYGEKEGGIEFITQFGGGVGEAEGFGREKERRGGEEERRIGYGGERFERGLSGDVLIGSPSTASSKQSPALRWAHGVM
ncbi:unnamed protein product, partial [Closterium sp. NIES-64]